MPMTNAQYVERSNVRKFLSEYARPTAIADLIDALSDNDSAEARQWLELLHSVQQQF